MEGGGRHSSLCEGFSGGTFVNSGPKEGFLMADDCERCAGDEDKR
jgi:hypothetical protein